MKKSLGIFLTLAMLLSMIPTAFASPALPDDSAAADTAVELADEPADSNSSEARSRKARADLRASEAIIPAEDEVSAFAAAQYSVTVNLALPQAATAGTSLEIYLASPAAVDSTGFVTDMVSYPYGDDFYVAKGTSSVSASFSVPAGNYIPVVCVYGAEVGAVAYKDYFFNADGTVASNGFTATPVSISGRKTINLSLPKAERTISGTLHFTTPLTKDTEFEFYTESSSNYSNNETYPHFTASEGSTSLDFSIPVDADSYSIQLHNYESDKWGYYDITGGISENYESRAHISTFQSSVTGLTINGDVLLGESSEEEGNSHKVTVSITPPEQTSGEKDYLLLLYNTKYNELWGYQRCYFDAKKETYTGSVWAEEDMKFVVGYVDVTGHNSFSQAEAYPTARFQGESGITSLVDNAKVYTMGTGDMSVSINDSSDNNYKLTGTLKLGGKKTQDCVTFAMAEFANGESFGARVNFPAGTTSVNYTIYVPKTQSGTFTHWAAEAASGRGVLLNEETLVDGSEYTLKNNLSLSAITLPVAEPNVTGTLSLPTGMTAPKGGLALRFRVNNMDVGYYYMAAGKSSVNFSFASSLYSDNAENQIRVYVQNAPDNLADQFRVYGTGDGDMTGLSLVVPETVVVSGTITVPEAAKDKSTVFEVYTNSYYDDDDPVFGTYSNYNNQTYATTLPGQTTAGYALKVIKDLRSRFYVEVYADATGKVLSTTQYLQPDGTIDTDNSSNAKLSQDTTLNFTFGEGKTISGTITLASGLTSDDYYGEICAEPTQGGESYRTYFSFTGTSFSYSLAVPADASGAYNVYFSLYDGPDNALTNAQVYYASTGVTTNEDDATPVTAPAENINLVIQPAIVVSGTVLLPEELENEYIEGNVYAIDSDNTYYNTYFATDYRMDYALKLPIGYSGTYKLAVYLYDSGETPTGLITGAYLYLTEDGTLSASEEDAKEFTIGSAGLSKDLTIPMGKTYTVTLKAPEGFSGTYDGYIRLYDLDSGSNLPQKYFTFEGSSTNITFTIPDNSTAKYTLRIYLYSGPGVITSTNYYYVGGSWATSPDETKYLDLSASSITVTMPKARTISVTLKAPEGFSGTYDGHVRLRNLATGNSLSREYFNFEGSSHTVTFSVPDDGATYTVQFYLDSGPGVITDTTYYYAGSTWVTSSDSATALPSDTATVTMPKARVISVTVNAPTGFSGDYSGTLYLRNKTTDSQIASQSFKFTGMSAPVSFSVPDDPSVTYTLSIFVNKGPGVVTQKNYYYAGDTWTTSSSSSAALTLTNDAAIVTMPKAKILSGKLVSADGSPIVISDEACYLSARNVSGSYTSYRGTMDSSGNFTFAIPGDYTGTLYLYCSVYSDGGSNLVPRTYHYHATSTVPVDEYTSSDTGFHIAVGEDDVTGLNILVETGYVLTGTVKLDSSATLTGEDSDPGDDLGSAYVSFGSTDFETGQYVSLTSGDTSWSYSIVLPKTTATYSLAVYVELYSDAVSNLYVGSMSCGTATVSGSGTLPDIVLKPAKATINVTFINPVEEYVSGYLYVKTGEDTTYNTYFYLDGSETDTFPITVSPTDSAETYQLYYNAHNTDGILSNTDIFVAADGSLTTDSSAAGSFSMTKTAHSLTLKDRPPYAIGKIYLPNDLDDEAFRICLYGSFSSYSYFDVSTDTIQTAPDGRKYIPYSLFSNNATPGNTYYLEYWLNDYSGALLCGTTAYLTTEGDVIYEHSYDDCTVTVPASGTTVMDFTLATWNDGNEGSVLQSAHGINSDAGTLTYTYTYPGATRLKVTFDERTDVYPTINGQDQGYVAGYTEYIDVSETGGAMTISITPSSSSYIYGFGIVSIEPYYDSEKATAPAVASVWAEKGTDNTSILAALKTGKPVRIAMVGPDATTGTLFSALYGSNGKLLEVVPLTPTFDNGQAFCDLTAENAENVSSLKLMYLDTTNRKPQMACATISAAP